MNRPYTDVRDTVLIKCVVCQLDIFYTHDAIEFHEKRCLVPEDFDYPAELQPVPPPPVYKKAT